MSRFTIHDLAATIDARAASGGDVSSTRKLLDKGPEHCAKKLGEEAVETVIASKNNSKEDVLYEMGDLWYHCLVLLAYHKLSPDQLLGELMSRRKGNAYHQFTGKSGNRPDL